MECNKCGCDGEAIEELIDYQAERIKELERQLQIAATQVWKERDELGARKPVARVVQGNLCNWLEWFDDDAHGNTPVGVVLYG